MAPYTDKGYTGQYNDALTGLDYYNVRYYDPTVGVFLSADTVQGNMQGMNPYAYVGGNPEINTDPTGKMMCSATCGGGGGSDPTPPPPPSPPSTSTGGTSGNYYQSVDHKLEQVKTISFIAKAYGSYAKFFIDNLILRNGAASVSDLVGCVSLCLPLSDSEDLWARLGINDTNTGRLQAELTWKNGDMGGFLPFLEYVSHGLNIVSILFYSLDLYLSIKSGNNWSTIADSLNIASTAVYYISKLLKKPALLAVSIVLAVGGMVMDGISIAMSGIDPGAPVGDNGGDGRKKNRSIGGGPGGFPPVMPSLSFFPPQPDEPNGPQIGIGGNMGEFTFDF